MISGFLLASLLLALAPGPDNLYVLSQSVMHGARVGIVITLGLCSGLLVHSALVAFGLAEVMASTTWALPLVGLVGSAYLAWIARGSWRAGADTITSGTPTSMAPSLFACYRTGVWMNISNPKVLLFFLAFLPQFIQPEQPVAPQVFVLGALFGAVALLVFSALACMGQQLARLLNKKPVIQIWINRATAVVLWILSVRLLWWAMQQNAGGT